MSSIDEALARDKAWDALSWSCAGSRFGEHPRNCGVFIQGLWTVRRRPDDPDFKCTCGLWDGIKLLVKSKQYQLLRQYQDEGLLPL